MRSANSTRTPHRPSRPRWRNRTETQGKEPGLLHRSAKKSAKLPSEAGIHQTLQSFARILRNHSCTCSVMVRPSEIEERSLRGLGSRKGQPSATVLCGTEDAKPRCLLVISSRWFGSRGGASGTGLLEPSPTDAVRSDDRGRCATNPTISGRGGLRPSRNATPTKFDSCVRRGLGGDFGQRHSCLPISDSSSSCTS